MSTVTEDILLENLKRLEKDRARLAALSRYELSLLAARVAGDIRRAEATDLTELLHAMRDVSFLRAARIGRAEGGIPMDEAAACRMGAIFSDFLAEELSALSVSDEMMHSTASNLLVACVRSPMVEELLSKAPVAERVREIAFLSGAEEICLSVAERRADCALLPLAYENGERITGIERLAERHDLYLTAVLRYATEEKTVSYGVFSLQNCSWTESNPRFLEVRIYGTEFESCAAIVSGCAELGFFAEEMRCGRDEYDRYAARVILRAEGNMFALRIYLSMLSAGYAELGTYGIMTLKKGDM